MIRYSYNAQISPPAPFVLVTLRNPLSGAELGNVPAQLDLAADRTLLPGSLAQNLALPAIGTLPIGGVGGTLANMPMYAVLLGLHALPMQLLEVVAHPDEPWVLLGRDVLNGLRLLLDGPGLILEID